MIAVADVTEFSRGLEFRTQVLNLAVVVLTNGDSCQLIPIIDIKPLLDSAAAPRDCQAVAETVSYACGETGFLYVGIYGIP